MSKPRGVVLLRIKEDTLVSGLTYRVLVFILKLINLHCLQSSIECALFGKEKSVQDLQKRGLSSRVCYQVCCDSQDVFTES